MEKVLGIDVGGTKISYCIINKNGEVLTQISKLSTPKTKQEIMAVFKDIISGYENEVDAIAFATAGAVNLQNTKVESSTPNLPQGYSDIDFSLLSIKPVYVENDANAAAFAEYKIGASKGHNNNITLTLGTGIGGGFIIDGRLLRGKSGRGGEVGSLKLYPDKRRKCTCNNYDCWESYASGTGLKNTAQEFASSHASFKTSIFNNKQPQEITTYDIIEGVKENDEYSLIVFEKWQNDLLSGLITITNIFDPESIVISGGIGEFLDFEKLKKELNSKIVVSPIKLLPAAMKNNAGMIGAALLVFEKYNKD